MGRLGEERWKEVIVVLDYKQQIYERWLVLNDDENSIPFMYGSLYSTMGIVLYYLLRVEPYTSVIIIMINDSQLNRVFQGGHFDCPERFGKLTSSQFDAIMMADSSLNRENILMAFLYINSYIGCRKKNQDGSELDNAKDNPEAFWRSIESMAKELAMSKDTINQCIEYLTTSSKNSPALLVKREVGSVQPDKSKPPKNVPNIYVLNKEGYEKEIEWALNKMKEIYEVDEFYPIKNGNHRFE